MEAEGEGSDAGEQPQRLRKELRLIDIYAICTGAMFSSGFFLLPGIASAQAGPAVVLAYLLAGIMVLPAMLSAAELSTAMPRAGGNYYFIDRSMGPMVGAIGGIGDWFALVSKSAFALVGMSAYIAIFVDVPIRPVAIALTLVFALLNIVGVKQATRLQVLIVGFLLIVLAYFVVAGLFSLLGVDPVALTRDQFTPFLPFGVEGVIATSGLVFVSYSGLTKVASVSEEVRNPNRDIPLGMILSLGTATALYVVGVFIMVAVLDPGTLREDLTPVATAAETFLPLPAGLLLIVAAAAAAFASTGNAGILSAARYPLAMARDRLLWRGFSRIGRFETPTSAILATAALMALFIVALDEEGIASIASAFNLLIFGLLNLAVIVMRESRIDAYDPGFRAPLYPWLQIAGVIVSIVLIAQIGTLTALLTLGVIVGCGAYYAAYARHRVTRDGAIYHIFERLGRRRDTGLDHELLDILAEQGVRDEDRFAEVVARAAVVELPDDADYDDAVHAAAEQLAERVGLDADRLAEWFTHRSPLTATPVSHGAALPHVLVPGVAHPELAIVRSRVGVDTGGGDGPDAPTDPVYALLFLVGDRNRAGQVLRILAQVGAHVDEDGFLRKWNVARDEQELKEVLLEEERFLSLRVEPDGPTHHLVGHRLRELEFPEGCLVALIRRGDTSMIPRGSTQLQAGDRLTVIGGAEDIRLLADRYTA
ncbi:MAG TPA: amino acid permease [Egibacteraceae bacterium]|nr:amino acid permease [Egibacteraceae bacterium]